MLTNLSVFFSVSIIASGITLLFALKGRKKQRTSTLPFSVIVINGENKSCASLSIGSSYGYVYPHCVTICLHNCFIRTCKSLLVRIKCDTSGFAILLA